MIHLQNWAVVALKFDPYKSPEAQAQGLHGIVSGHPRFSDGESITTSRIVKADDHVVTTQSGTQYRLGKVDPAYERIYPDAYARVFKRMMP